jgi:hypothetical protein
MAGVYTTNALVTSQLKGATLTVTTAEIDEFINQAEGYFQAILKIPSTFTFTSTKLGHQILRIAVTSLAAMMVLAAEPGCYNSTDQASLSADILYTVHVDAKKMLLENPGYCHYIESQ